MKRNQQEKERLNRLAEKLEQLATPREISIQSIIYMEQLHKMEKQRAMYKRLFFTYLNEVIVLREKLSVIQAITNPDQTQESEQ